MRALPILLALAVVPGTSVIVQPSHFSDQEVSAVRSLWTEAGRYRAMPAGEAGSAWAPRLTPEGSEWLLRYFKAKSGSNAKVKPGEEPPPPDPRFEVWDKWVDSKYAYDEWLAGQVAWASNQEMTERALPRPAGVPAPDPGPADPALVQLAGELPQFVKAVRPLKHTVRFEDGTTLEYQDHVGVRRKYAYYRFDQGVISMGRRVRTLPSTELDPILREAGISESEQRIFAAVSALEGGFDSINTYDTGFVSVGLIQFACLSEGGGSLGGVLLRTKRNAPGAFEEYFRRYGLDVTDDGRLVALDVYTGDEKVGRAAAEQIIADKRLIACFQRAGLKCRPFQVAQLQVAKDSYYPADDIVTVDVGGKEMKARVGDIFKTEAGLATLMDRKVNTGTLDPLKDVLAEVVTQMGYETLEQAGQAEYLLTRMLAYREDYLVSSVSLSKPRDTGITLSRGGDRIPPQ